MEGMGESKEVERKREGGMERGRDSGRDEKKRKREEKRKSRGRKAAGEGEERMSQDPDFRRTLQIV